jgi:lysozyme
MKLIEQLKRHEGFRDLPYQCTEGVWTFGYGLTNITRDEAEIVLRMRVDQIADKLFSHISSLNTARQNVIINMAYNLGILGVMNFKKMWQAIYAGDFDGASTEMLSSKWAKQVGNRAVELADIMRKGEM